MTPRALGPTRPPRDEKGSREEGDVQQLTTQLEEMRRNADAAYASEMELRSRLEAMSVLASRLGERCALPADIRGELNTLFANPTAGGSGLQALEDTQASFSPRGGDVSDASSSDATQSSGSSGVDGPGMLPTQAWEYPLSKTEKQARLNLLFDSEVMTAARGEKMQQRENRRLRRENRQLRQTRRSSQLAVRSKADAETGGGACGSSDVCAAGISGEINFVVQANRLGAMLERCDHEGPEVESPPRWNRARAGAPLAIADEEWWKRPANVLNDLFNPFLDVDEE